jgi:hypothetical protein
MDEEDKESAVEEDKFNYITEMADNIHRHEQDNKNLLPVPYDMVVQQEPQVSVAPKAVELDCKSLGDNKSSASEEILGNFI